MSYPPQAAATPLRLRQNLRRFSPCCNDATEDQFAGPLGAAIEEKRRQGPRGREAHHEV